MHAKIWTETVTAFYNVRVNYVIIGATTGSITMRVPSHCYSEIATRFEFITVTS